MLTPEQIAAALDAAEGIKPLVNNSGGITSMDWYTAGQFLWQCFSEKYPEIAGGGLQVVGGATILYRLLGSTKLAGSGSSLIGLLGKLALNK